MRSREAGWLILAAGLPWSALLFHKLGLDVWHGQATFAHFGLAALLCHALATGWPEALPNRPLGVWFAWVTLSTLWAFTVASGQKVLRGDLLLGWMHLLTLVVFYLLAQAWTLRTLERVLTAMAWSGVVVLGYCLLQLLGLDQFYKDAAFDHDRWHDLVVGTIGNPSHLSAYLSLLWVLLLHQQGRGWWVARAACVGWLAYLLLTGGAVGGAVSAFAVTVVWAWRRSRWGAAGLLTLGVVALSALWAFIPNILNPWGRLEAWRLYAKWLAVKPITGLGVGAVRTLSEGITAGPLAGWRHVHNEFLQVGLEQGLIGLGLLLWALGHAAARLREVATHPLAETLGLLLVAFGLNSLVSFPGHLWVLSFMGLVAYSGTYVLARETGSAWR